MKINNQLFKNPILWAFCASLTYWFYLALTSHMEISCDAAAYELLGKTLLQKGWPDYFINGPNREPFYPFLVFICMKIGAVLSLPYQPIQIFLQFSILFITQLLMLRILRLLEVNKWVSAFTIVYLGISPAIVNSALCLFSEIATYPMILAAILFTYKSWVSLSGPKSRIILFAIITGIIFVILTLTKAIFEHIAIVFIGLFFLSTFPARNRKFILNGLLFFIITMTVFYSFITGYKMVNKVFNGNFVVTSRGSVMLYGSIARRIEPLTTERFLAALAYIPGEGVCEAIFGKERCDFWSLSKSDEFGYMRVGDLSASGFRPEQIDKEIIRAALKKILQNPSQFFLLWLMEGSKMFFWESTQVGFASYSVCLTKLFCWFPIKNGLRLLMAILTCATLIYLIIFLLREIKNIFTPQSNIKILLFLITIFIILFTGFYAMCNIIIRYIFPIVPLYLIIAAFVLQKIFFTKDERLRCLSMPTPKNFSF